MESSPRVTSKSSIAAKTSLAAGWVILQQPVVAVALTLLLLLLCTWGLIELRHISHQSRPYTILYLIPVAIGAALLGTRGGIVVSLLVLVLARIYLLNDQKQGFDLFASSPNMAEGIEFTALAAGTLTIALVTGWLRSTLSLLGAANAHLQQVNVQLTESEEQRRAFNRDVLLAVTGGKLRLIETDEMPPEDMVIGEPTLTVPLREPADASALRRNLQQIASRTGMEPSRLSDLCTSATEAATNAIKHGNGGIARVWERPEAMLVQIQDFGHGIEPAHLARATLEPGYSTRVSLGMGFHLMLQTTDLLALSTNATGTSILLKVGSQPQPTEEDRLLARYASV